MCKILIHHYAFELAIFHAYVSYSNFLLTRACVKKGHGVEIYIYIYNALLDACLAHCY